MAFPAVNGLVFATQCKICQDMIELIRINVRKRSFIVAFGTISSKLVVMHVIMAGSTIIGANTWPILKEVFQRVAFGTIADTFQVGMSLG